MPRVLKPGMSVPALALNRIVRPVRVRGIVSVEDRVITVAVRRVLTAMWLDITQVRVRVTRSVVYLTGHAQRMTASHIELTPEILREMDTRLRRLPNVRDVKYRLDNWRRYLDGSWSVASPEQSLTLEIDETTAGDPV
jgi:hypothetical protein